MPQDSAPGIQQLSTTPETDADSVRKVTRWATVLPPSGVPLPAVGGMSTTFQPTTANLESRAFTAHLTGLAGSRVTWKSTSASVASVVLYPTSLYVTPESELEVVTQARKPIPTASATAITARAPLGESRRFLAPYRLARLESAGAGWAGWSGEVTRPV